MTSNAREELNITIGVTDEDKKNAAYALRTIAQCMVDGDIEERHYNWTMAILAATIEG